MLAGLLGLEEDLVEKLYGVVQSPAIATQHLRLARLILPQSLPNHHLLEAPACGERLKHHAAERMSVCHLTKGWGVRTFCTLHQTPV